MKINTFNPNTVNLSKKTVFSSNSISTPNFKGLEVDSFEKQEGFDEQKLVKRIADIEEEIKKQKTRAFSNEEIRRLEEIRLSREELIARFNPNAAFFADKSLNFQEKREIAKQHPEIIHYTKEEAESLDETYLRLLKEKKYFIRSKIGGLNYIDSSWSVNKSNYEKLTGEEVISNVQFRKKYDINNKDFLRYLKEGYLENVILKNHITGEEETVPMIDMSNKTNIEGINRYITIKNLIKKSPAEIGQWVPVNYLTKLGYGTEEEIKKAFLNRYKKAFYEKEIQDSGEKKAYVHLDDIYAKDILFKLKNTNKNVKDIEALAKSMKNCTVSDIEDAILSGEIEHISQYLYDFEANKIFIDLKNKKNIRYINKKKFENIIINEELENQPQEQFPLRLRIISQFCPNTRKTAKQIISQTPCLKDILEKIDTVKDFEEKITKEKTEKYETKPLLTKEERETLNRFYQTLWEKAGMEEYKEAMIKSTKAIREYKEGGIDSVTDETIKDIIKDYFQE